eukprot:CAMPEP_0168173422 /NCGR_PEP_ID=MMETSP0139_2-20121125/5882_1 /TAXON_ID=44445 /ORGANISM="Pseudo-nitzschia australis, Strain 10249 10 AB" /LENGTH=61 /DNA_ID=CAMNT_0008091345 /DNA_START=249 /DNA_END=434 /DNA_ORIENTATION=+
MATNHRCRSVIVKATSWTVVVNSKTEAAVSYYRGAPVNGQTNLQATMMVTNASTGEINDTG